MRFVSAAVHLIWLNRKDVPDSSSSRNQVVLVRPTRSNLSLLILDRVLPNGLLHIFQPISIKSRIKMMIGILYFSHFF